MNNKLPITISKYSLLLFNPLVFPTLGLLIIMAYLPGVELYSIKAKIILILVVFVSTCLLPLSFKYIVSLSPGYSNGSTNHRDKILPYLFTLLSFFLGAQLLAKLPFPSVFWLLLMGSCAILFFLSITSIWWKISGQTAALGGLTGTLFALTFKYGIDFLYPILVVTLISGIIASLLVYHSMHTPAQTYWGFGISTLIMYFTIYFY